MEANGLRMMSEVLGSPRVPNVIGFSQKVLVLEYIQQGVEGSQYWEVFAQSLAHVHQHHSEYFGLKRDNYIGRTKQINTQCKDAIVFFRDYRLGFQQELARKNGYLSIELDKQITKLRSILESILCVANELPSLVHGDLWSGNHFSDEDGKPCFFDPAVHFGLRETDIAMTELFGRLPQRFYDAYQEVLPLQQNYSDRRDLYDLYHMLNHLNLFGTGYLPNIKRIVSRYT